MLKNNHKCECPMCGGKGYILRIQPHFKYTPAQRNKARELYRQGLSLREIGRKMKISGSPQKIKSMMMSKIIS